MKVLCLDVMNAPVPRCHERIVSAWTNFKNCSACSQLCEYSRMRVFRQVWVWDLRTCTPVRRLIGSHLETLCASLSSAGVLSVLRCSVLQRLIRMLRVKISYSSGSDLSDLATRQRNTLHHTTLQHTTLHCNKLAIHYNTLQ